MLRNRCWKLITIDVGLETSFGCFYVLRTLSTDVPLCLFRNWHLPMIWLSAECLIRIYYISPRLTLSWIGLGELFVVPLEVEVSADPGLYSPQNVLDFGVLHSRSEPKTLPLFVINSSTKPVEIAVSYTLLRDRWRYYNNILGVVKTWGCVSNPILVN